MQWIEIAGMLLGSSVLSSMVTLVATRNKRAAEADGTVSEHYDTYAERLEQRLKSLESRIALLELRDSIFDRAITTTYKCPYVKDCPSLDFLRRHPLPSKVDTDYENQDNSER